MSAFGVEAPELAAAPGSLQCQPCWPEQRFADPTWEDHSWSQPWDSEAIWSGVEDWLGGPWEATPAQAGGPWAAPPVQQLYQSLPVQPVSEAERAAGSKVIGGVSAQGDKPEACIFAMQAEAGGEARRHRGENRIMLDTGAEENVCVLRFAKGAGQYTDARVRLRDVAGRPIEHRGTRALQLGLEDQTQLSTDFQLAPVKEPIMSVGRAIETGMYRMILEKEGSRLESLDTGRAAPLERVGRKFYLRVLAGVEAHLPEAGVAVAHTFLPSVGTWMHHKPPAAAPAAEPATPASSSAGPAPPAPEPEPPPQEAVSKELGNTRPVDAPAPWLPAGLRPYSSVADMKRELRKMSAPIYGSKDMLWQRVLGWSRQVASERALQERTCGRPHREDPTAAARTRAEHPGAKRGTDRRG